MASSLFFPFSNLGASRTERAALQKQSKQEADQSIAEFKASKDAEYKQLTSSVDTSGKDFD